MGTPREVRANRGTELQCKGWVQEAVLRMLHNNLDPEVAERPEDLVVYGGTGRAARNWTAFEKIEAALKDLENDETLLVQSGKPVGIFKSHKDAPRVLLANSLLVPKWADWDYFRDLENKGLMMYGQMTAGSWIYIGTQGILQGTYETFTAAAQTHYGTDSLAGRLIVTAGLGGMGGAQPLAVTMNEGVCLAAEVEKERIQKRLDTRYLDVFAPTIEEGIDQALAAVSEQRSVSIGVHCNAVDLFDALRERGIVPDMVTDQTSAHDPLGGYVPSGMTMSEALELRSNDPKAYEERSLNTMSAHVEAMLECQRNGSHVFDYGNNIRQFAYDNGVENAFKFPGFVPAYIRPLFCEGKGPFRWVALSGDPEDIYATDDVIRSLFPDNKPLMRWLDMARDRIAFQGLPARICWLGYGERMKAGLAFNELVRSGKVKAPIVIGRDHLDCGSVASPNRETESMKDGSDAVADWPILNAMINSVNGASWVSVHHGGGVGIGYSIHSGMVVVADGTDDADARLKRVLTSDPGMGVIRHADAGYEQASDFARKNGVRIP